MRLPATALNFGAHTSQTREKYVKQKTVLTRGYSNTNGSTTGRARKIFRMAFCTMRRRRSLRERLTMLVQEAFATGRSRKTRRLPCCCGIKKAKYEKNRFCVRICHQERQDQDLFKVGAMDEITMREIDKLCLTSKPPIQAEDVRRIRHIVV